MMITIYNVIAWNNGKDCIIIGQGCQRNGFYFLTFIHFQPTPYFFPLSCLIMEPSYVKELIG